MGTHQNVIELNGKAYDASTGKPLDPEPDKPVAPPVITPMTQPITKPSTGAVMDGFFKKPRHAATPKPAHHRKTTPAAHHKPQKASTLMRHTVSKPATTSEGDTDHMKELGKPKDERLARAKTFNKSSFISKFGKGAHRQPVHKAIEPIAVKPAPKHPKQTHSGPVHQTPPPIPHHPKHTVHHTAAPDTAEAHFNRALSKAQSHESLDPSQMHHKKRLAHRLGVSQKTLRLASSSLAAILLIGFFAYQNIPNISMRIAAQRAGFSAKLPDYRPSDFALAGPIEYGPGQIVVNFKSNADDRQFNVSQKLSNWNSEALVDNYLTANNKTYQTYEDKGRTIYTYEGANATWVSGGVWYQIEGDSSLTNDQLLKIATSM